MRDGLRLHAWRAGSHYVMAMATPLRKTRASWWRSCGPREVSASPASIFGSGQGEALFSAYGGTTGQSYGHHLRRLSKGGGGDQTPAISFGGPAGASSPSCSDVNECQVGTPCGAGQASCTNLPGSYKCTCQDGFELSTDEKSCAGASCWGGGNGWREECKVCQLCGTDHWKCGTPQDYLPSQFRRLSPK